MADLFVSYARTDAPFVRRLEASMVARGQDVWVDWKDILPTADWLAEVRTGIEGAGAFVVVLTPDSARSEICAAELAHAVALNKRLIPLLRRPLPADDVAPDLRRPNWIHVRDAAEEAAGFDALERALATDLEWVRLHTRLLVKAIEWEAQARDRGRLLRGKELEAAEERLASPPGDPEPTALQREYVRESRLAAARRQRIVVGAVSVALAVSIVLGLLALWQRGRAIDERDVARSRELTAASGSLLSLDPAASVGLAADATDLRATPESLDALSEALIRSHLIATLPTTGGTTAGVSDDARTVLTLDEGTARLWRWAADGARPAAELGAPGEPVAAAALSADGASAATAGGGRTRIWTANGAQRRTLATGPVTQLALSRDGRRLLALRADRVATAWDARSGARLADLPGDATRVLLSADGSTAMTWGDRGIALWGAGDGSLLLVIDAAGASAAGLSADGRRAVVGGSDGVARVWRSRGGSAPTRLAGHRGQITSAAFSPDGAMVLTAGIDGTARIWSAADGVPLRTLAAPAGGPLVSARFSSDPRRVVTAGDDGVAHVFDARTGSERVALAGSRGNLLEGAIAADGAVVVTSSYDGEVRVWDAARGAGRAELSGHRAPVVGVAFDPSGARVLTVGFDGAARIWDGERAVAVLRGHRGAVQAGAFSPAGRLAATGGWDGTVRVWTTDGRLRHVLRDGEGRGIVYAVAFSADGRLLLGASADGVATVWDPRSGRRVAALDAGAGAVVTAGFDPAARRVVAAGEDGVVRTWDVRTGELEAALEGHRDRVVSAAFAADGRRVLTASLDGEARLWDLDRPTAPIVMSTPAQVVDAALDPAGGTVATAGQDGLVRLWDARSGVLRAELAGHTGPVVAVRFSPDGRRVAAASEDGTARVWSSGSGRRLALLSGGRNALVTLAFAPDGRIATAGIDGVARVYECDRCAAMEDPVALARG